MVKIYKHTDGPFMNEDDRTCFAVFLAKVEGDLCHIEVEFDSFDEAYEVIKSLNEIEEAVSLKDGVRYQ